MTSHTPNELDPRRYWEERLSARYALDGVGYAGLSEPFNVWMYRVRRRVFLREMGGLFANPADLSVLDIGSGTGFYVERWHELGVGPVTGSDITDVAVARLRERHPGDAFVQLDVGADVNELAGQRFGAVSALDVLFHIEDDDRFRRAFTNVFGLLEPGGILVFSENFLHGPAIRMPSQASRPLEQIERAIRDAGFEILRRRPMFCLMNAPIDSDSRVLDAWWRLVQRAAARQDVIGAKVGGLIYPFELALVSRLREGPSTELMICRRPPESAAR